MDAAGVIADHAAEAAPFVSGGIGAEGEMKFLSRSGQLLVNDSRLDSREFFNRIDLNDPIHVFGVIDDDRDVAALPGETRASPARSDRRAELAAEREGFQNILLVARDDDAKRHLAVIRAVGCVESAVPVVETHFAFDFAVETVAEGLGGGA